MTVYVAHSSPLVSSPSHSSPGVYTATAPLAELAVLVVVTWLGTDVWWVLDEDVCGGHVTVAPAATSENASQEIKKLRKILLGFNNQKMPPPPKNFFFPPPYSLERNMGLQQLFLFALLSYTLVQ